MKKILVLTDFTANASHAELAALSLSAKLKAGILLYHTLSYIPLIPSDSRGPFLTETASILFEDSIDRLCQEANTLKMLAKKMPGYKLEIDCSNSEGSLKDTIRKLTDQSDIEMVVMGGRSGKVLDHIFSGSDTTAVISEAKKPVLIIPMKTDWNIPRKVVFATNFGTSDIPAVSFLIRLSLLIGFQLDIVHVLNKGEVVADMGPEAAFRKYLVRHQLTCNQVFGPDGHQGLQRYCEEKKADLLAMTHGYHPFISRLFGHSDSLAVASNQHLAMLVFPLDFK